MVKIPLDEVAYFPPHFAGKWRLTILGFFEQNGEVKTECGYVYGDLFDSPSIAPKKKH
jgi:hypothetical protein